MRLGVEGMVAFDNNQDVCALTSYADDLKLYAHSGAALSHLFSETKHYLAAFGMTTSVEKSNLL